MNAKPIETVCIVGAGFMGAQIGLHCASQLSKMPPSVQTE